MLWSRQDKNSDRLANEAPTKGLTFDVVSRVLRRHFVLHIVLTGATDVDEDFEVVIGAVPGLQNLGAEMNVFRPRKRMSP